ncbi:MAG: nucleotidyltransferase domain-containing protein [Ferruginibacter sp.]
MNNTAHNILKTLGYFDLFHYPLTAEEICMFHPENIAASAIAAELEMLVNEKFIFKLDSFYSLHYDYALQQKRNKANQLAAEQMKLAVKIAAFLSRFPYVKGIGVSGSLSKNVATEYSDIDFFIVTASNRLWIARTAMHLYKKLTFLTGRQRWFCMNYYVDEAELEIPEKNIFTAIEIITLLPMQGNRSLTDFRNNNNWTRIFFPAHKANSNSVPEIQKGMLVRFLERSLNNKLGDRIDKWLMRLTDSRWKKKALQQRLDDKGSNMGMSVGRHFSKPDPKNFQQKILSQYQLKMQEIEDLAHQPSKISA